jgi:hypothetical protein
MKIESDGEQYATPSESESSCSEYSGDSRSGSSNDSYSSDDDDGDGGSDYQDEGDGEGDSDEDMSAMMVQTSLHGHTNIGNSCHVNSVLSLFQLTTCFKLCFSRIWRHFQVASKKSNGTLFVGGGPGVALVALQRCIEDQVPKKADLEVVGEMIRNHPPKKKRGTQQDSYETWTRFWAAIITLCGRVNGKKDVKFRPCRQHYHGVDDSEDRHEVGRLVHAS